MIYVATSFLAPKPVDWTVTFSNQDTNPFGAYILSEQSSDLFREPFEVSNNTISQLNGIDNLLILADQVQIEGADYRSLIAKLDSGAHIFIAANQFSPLMQDTLGFDETFSFHILNQTIFEAATSTIRIGDSISYEYPFQLVSNYFELPQPHEWSSKATLEGKPILISRNFGKGQLTLCSTPYVFTNFGLLYNENHQGASRLLSQLPERKTHLTLFYQLGKGEAATPLRYFLREPALKWALYLGVLIILLFLIVSSRRVQRPIPVVTPPVNSTVHYVKTLGALFYREGKHKRAAHKLVNYFLRSIRERYFLSIDYSEHFYKQLSAKAGVELPEVIQTFELILRVRDLPYVEERLLIELAKKIERFN